jgi:hypothetical protein
MLTNLGISCVGPTTGFWIQARCLLVLWAMGFSRISREVSKEKEVRGAYCTTHVWGWWIRPYGSTSRKSSPIIFFHNHMQWYVTNCYMQEAEIGSLPRPTHLYRQGYKGSNPENPDALCSQVATNWLVSYSQIWITCSLFKLSCKFGS